ncbi:hypothetical protein M0R04_12735 [Candidatus Dojkabacteria bacterium]|jgi:hypothetical protein|nr:hypothetical protein [Candidatus Dojkabacteria bacterium]
MPTFGSHKIKTIKKQEGINEGKSYDEYMEEAKYRKPGLYSGMVKRRKGNWVYEKLDYS